MSNPAERPTDRGKQVSQATDGLEYTRLCIQRMLSPRIASLELRIALVLIALGFIRHEGALD